MSNGPLSSSVDKQWSLGDFCCKHWQTTTEYRSDTATMTMKMEMAAQHKWSVAYQCSTENDNALVKSHSSSSWSTWFSWRPSGRIGSYSDAILVCGGQTRGQKFATGWFTKENSFYCTMLVVIIWIFSKYVHSNDRWMVIMPNMRSSFLSSSSSSKEHL